MALSDTHVAGCGEHLPAWGLRDDRIPGTDQTVGGGRHGLKLHSGSPPPPRQVDARGSADARGSTDACLSWQKVQGREANRRRHRLTEPTTKALCHSPLPPPAAPGYLVPGVLHQTVIWGYVCSTKSGVYKAFSPKPLGQGLFSCLRCPPPPTHPHSVFALGGFLCASVAPPTAPQRLLCTISVRKGDGWQTNIGAAWRAHVW